MLAILGIVLLPRVGSGSPRAWLLDNYRLVSSEGDAITLSSTDAPTQVVDDLTDAWSPADRVVDAAGVFLRYSDLVVAVTPDGEGGSRIEADDEEDGYVRFFPFVAGYWGSPGVGGGSGFRGGGPGGGK